MTSSRQFSVESDYMSLDAILAAGSTVPMQLNENAPPGIFPLIGHAAPPSIGPRGIRVDIPLWLASSVKDGHYGMAMYPTGYNIKYQNVLQANADTMSLDQLHHYYYTFGQSLCRIISLDLASPLSKSLLSTWIQRCGIFFSRSLQGQTRIDGATKEELAVFMIGVKTKEDFDRWLRAEKRQGSNKRKLAPYNR
ncbi:unnamed protein product, partial [Mesorhabditis belari]|uniref:DNA replication complex GINS protein PSF3 n=1 Tax=Mesorhabditis belari TaxID=2138241 RepID=A0AAF3F0F2_9BILA